MMKAELEQELNSHFAQKYPSMAGEYEIIAKPLGIAEISSDHVKNLVTAIYWTYLQMHPYSYSRFYILVKEFASAFKDEMAVKELKKIWNGNYRGGIPLPMILAHLKRVFGNPMVGPQHKYRYKSKAYSLGDLEHITDYALSRIMHIFNEVYLKNEVSVQFQMPVFDANSMAGGMPKL